MRSKYWTFVEDVEDAQSVRAVREHLGRALNSLGVGSFALLTHAPPADIGSLGVYAYNWPEDAIDHLFGGGHGFAPNPLFEAVEQGDGVLHWSSPLWLSTLSKDQLTWLAKLRQLIRGHAATKLVRSPLVSASCSIAASEPLDPDQMRVCMRIANYAFQQVQFLQRPQISGAERITTREHEVLYRAAVFGERPSIVARKIGVKVSTVRTLRQKAYGRLDAESPEQATWRMIETRQLFRGGRKGKPRTW
jgi:DNA-binding CsgD family transcriptional regulator